MKKLLLLLGSALLMSACDDGDLTVENISFDQVTSAKCASSNVIYKLNDTEALILEIGNDIDFAAAFHSDATPEGTPRTYEINGNNRVVYRSYDGDVETDNICGTIPPANPSVIEEWTATSGIIEIITTATKTANSNLEGGERITGYKHAIVFRNITFEKPTGTQVYETFLFGDYNVTVTPPPFNTNPAQLQKCATSNLLFNFSGSEAFTLDIDPALIVNEVTTPGNPRTGLLSPTLNKLLYTRFTTGGLSADYFCTSPTPTTPGVLEVWNGADGVSGVSGIVEVTTTTSGGFLHEVRLRNVTLIKGNSSFKLANDFLLGSFITN